MAIRDAGDQGGRSVLCDNKHAAHVSDDLQQRVICESLAIADIARLQV